MTQQPQGAGYFVWREDEKSLNPLRRLMDRTTLADALAFKREKAPTVRQLVSFPDDLPLAEAVNRLAKNRVLSAPVNNINGECIGLIDTMDIACFAVACTPAPDKLEKGDAQTWQLLSRMLRETPVGQLINVSRKNPYIQIRDNQPISTAVSQFAAGAHRVAVFGGDDKFAGIFSQYDLMCWLAAQLSAKSGELSKMASKTIRDFGIGKGFEIPSVQTDSKVIDALAKMVVAGVTGLAVIDASTGRLVGNFSSADLRGLYQEEFPTLTAPVGDFLMEYSPDSLNPRVEREPLRSLGDILKTFVAEHVRRLWVIDGNFRPINVISMTDICNIALRGTV